MREILFRGKQTDDGKWRYGSLSMDYGDYCDKEPWAQILRYDGAKWEI